jgi:hypothetical protein
VTGGAAAGIGPAVSKNVAYAAVTVGLSSLLGAFDAATGQLLWSGAVGTASITATPSVGSSKVFVPSGNAINAFADAGCSGPSCSPLFALESRSEDPPGEFLATPAISGSKVFATNGNGSLYRWQASGCSAPACAPVDAVPRNRPSGGSTTYSQAVAVVSGMVFVSAQQDVAGVDHVIVFALADTNLAQVHAWDTGEGVLGPALASVSVAYGVVYAPTDSALIALQRPPVGPMAALSVSPLTLSPAFSASTFDYVVQCASGTNDVTIEASAVPGGSVQLTAPTSTQPADSMTEPVQLVENQAVVIRGTDAQGRAAEYWIRCLPHDFPQITVDRPSPGGPTPGWYVLGNSTLFGATGIKPYAMILDTKGTPVWYRRPQPAGPENVTPLGKNTVAYMQRRAGTRATASIPTVASMPSISAVRRRARSAWSGCRPTFTNSCPCTTATSF